VNRIAELEKSKAEVTAKNTIAEDKISDLNTKLNESRDSGKKSEDAAALEKANTEAILNDKKNEVKDADAAASAVKMLRHGVSAGMALGLLAPLVKTNGTELHTTKLVAIPYVAVMPSYFFQSAPRATYCASTGLGETEDIAQRAANKRSREDAKLTHERHREIARSFVLRETGDTESNRIRSAKKKFKEAADAQAAEIKDPDEQRKKSEVSNFIGDEFLILDRRANGATPTEVEALEINLVNRLAEARWKSDVAGACGWNRLGLYFGRPFDFEADMTVSGKRGLRTVSPVFSAGATYMPNSYVSVMAGVTLGSTKEETATGVTIDRHVWALTIGIGGTLDAGARLVAK
jgi:hypothetical protein